MTQGWRMNSARSRSSMLNDTIPGPPSRRSSSAVSTASFPRSSATSARVRPSMEGSGRWDRNWMRSAPPRRSRFSHISATMRWREFRIVEALAHPVGPPLLRPPGHEGGGEPGGRGRVGVLVGKDLEPLGAGPLDATHHGRGVAPDPGPQRLDVRDDGARPRLPGHRDHLVHRRHEADGVVRFVADVARVDPPKAAATRASSTSSSVDAKLPARRRAPTRVRRRPLPSPAHERAHLVELFGGGVAVLHSDHLAAHRAVRHEEGGVHAESVGLELGTLRHQVHRAAAIGVQEDGGDPLHELRGVPPSAPGR
jgi:hypothetical protein